MGWLTSSSCEDLQRGQQFKVVVLVIVLVVCLGIWIYQWWKKR